MDASLAFCGLDCSQCPSYLGTVSGDTRLLEETAARWGAYSDPPEKYSLTDVICLGCRNADDTFLFSRCRRCEIRSCAVERGIPICAACSHFDQCDNMRRFYEEPSKGRVMLTLLRRKIEMR